MSKKIKIISMVLCFLFLPVMGASAMHISEGFLQPGWCIAWGALCIPFVIAGIVSIQKKLKVNPKHIVLLAMCGAFAFVLSALKIPSVTGSCSHPTGVGLGAIMFGPTTMSVLGLIVLIFQAVLLAHGGITTLGANTFSMAITGPFAAYGIYRLCKKSKVNPAVSVFLAAALGDLITYCITSIQLAVAFPDGGSFFASLGKFLTIFAVTQIPIAICEGLLTVIVFNVLQKYSNKELKELQVV